MDQVGVVGTTSWGTTLAVLLARNGLDVRLWARTEAEATALSARGENSRFVPDVEFPPGLKVTASADDAFHEAGLVIIAVPSRSFRANVRRVCDSLQTGAVVVSATKGLEHDTGMRMSQVMEQELPDSLHNGICALTGPNLAKEIVAGKPASTVIASHSADAAQRAQKLINTQTFRVYTNDDIIGAELGGALKNIIALGAGICDARGYGDNAKAAFLARGLAEITRLGVAAGANPLTFAGLAGMGDLVATCASGLSRNHFVGEQLAAGKTVQETRAAMQNVAEGIDTTAAAVTLARNLGVEMPITEAAYNVLFNSVPLDRAISNLLERAPRPE